MTRIKAAAAELRFGTRRHAFGYEGVIRDGKHVIASCGHAHRNRDLSTQASGRSARDCITGLAKAGRNEHTAASLRGEILGHPARYARVWQVTDAGMKEMRDAATAQAAELDKRVAEIAAVVGSRPFAGYTDGVVPTSWCPRA